jgi:hypothetical protein
VNKTKHKKILAFPYVMAVFNGAHLMGGIPRGPSEQLGGYRISPPADRQLRLFVRSPILPYTFTAPYVGHKYGIVKPPCLLQTAF